jgi:PRTRC genetic system protein E
MFVALEALVRAAGKLSVLLLMDGDQMRVIVVPQGEAKEAALRQPLILTAPPAELDEGFIDAVRGYASARQSLAEQVAATAAILESAEKSQSGKAQKALAKGSKPALPAPSSAKPESSSTEDNDDDESTEESAASASAQSGAPASESGRSDLFSLL